MKTQKENTGAAWLNSGKETEAHPDYRGYANVNGIDKYLAVWVKTAKDGSGYLSLSFTDPKPENPTPVTPAPIAKKGGENE